LLHNQNPPLQERLEREKELTKNLGEAAKKLQTLLKQTQDELNKERMKSKDVQVWNLFDHNGIS